MRLNWFRNKIWRPLTFRDLLCWLLVSILELLLCSVGVLYLGRRWVWGSQQWCWWRWSPWCSRNVCPLVQKRSPGARLPRPFPRPQRTWWSLQTQNRSVDEASRSDGSGSSLSLTCFFSLFGVLADVILGPPVCENQSDSGDVATGWTSSLRLGEAVLQHVLQRQTRHRPFLHVFNLQWRKCIQGRTTDATCSDLKAEWLVLKSCSKSQLDKTLLFDELCSCYLHDCSFDLLSRVVHVEGELCPDPAGVLNQTHPGTVSRHV